MIVDLANLEAWQGFVALLGVLGLSPAPWLLGMALNRIQFTAPAEKAYAERTTELKEAHAITVDNLKAAHSAAIAEIVNHHAQLVAVKDTQYAELKESRNYYRQARLAEADRADKATDQLAEVVEVVKANVQLLDAFDKAVQEAN